MTDPHGASTTIQVGTVHTGDYNPNLGSGGSGGKPISIDLDGNGFNFTNVDDSNVFFDINGDGWKHRMAWMAPGDGLLAFDADGNGLIDNGSEISFAGYRPDAQTDLEGLKAFDTNNDGLFSALDAQWGKFGVWQDASTGSAQAPNGITDPGEFKSLNELGIASVNLTSNGQFQVINGQTVHGIGQINKTDGSTLNIADVIDAGAGNDIVYAGAGNDLVIGGEGDDVVRCSYALLVEAANDPMPLAA